MDTYDEWASQDDRRSKISRRGFADFVPHPVTGVGGDVSSLEGYLYCPDPRVKPTDLSHWSPSEFYDHRNVEKIRSGSIPGLYFHGSDEVIGKVRSIEPDAVYPCFARVCVDLGKRGDVPDDLFEKVQRGIKSGETLAFSVGGRMTPGFKEITEVSLVRDPRQKGAVVNKVQFSEDGISNATEVSVLSYDSFAKMADESSAPQRAPVAAPQPAPVAAPQADPDTLRYIEAGRRAIDQEHKKTKAVGKAYDERRPMYKSLFAEANADEMLERLRPKDHKSGKAMLRVFDEAHRMKSELESGKSAVEKMNSEYESGKKEAQAEIEKLRAEIAALSEKAGKSKKESNTLKEKLVRTATGEEPTAKKTVGIAQAFAVPAPREVTVQNGSKPVVPIDTIIKNSLASYMQKMNAVQ